MTTKFLTRSAPVLIGIFIFFNIFPHTTAIKQISFYLCVFIVLLLIIFKKRDFTFKTPLTLPFVVFILWSGLSIFWALNKDSSLHDFYAYLLRYLALYYIVINFFNSKRQFIALTWVIIISVSIFSIGGLICFAHTNNILESRFGFKHADINIIGATSLPVVLLMTHHLTGEKIKPYWKVLLIFLLSGTFMATLLTYSRGTYVAIIASFIVLFWNNKKRLFVSLLLIMIFLGGLYAGSAGFKSRINGNAIFNNARLLIWHTSLEMIKDYPITGFGWGGGGDIFKENWVVYNDRLPDRYRFKAFPFCHPHNLLLDITTRIGLVGISLFLYIALRLVKMNWEIIKNGKDNFISGWGLCLMAAVVGMFVIGMFDNILRHTPFCTLSILFAGITILWNLNKSSEEGRSVMDNAQQVTAAADTVFQ